MVVVFFVGLALTSFSRPDSCSEPWSVCKLSLCLSPKYRASVSTKEFQFRYESAPPQDRGNIPQYPLALLPRFHAGICVLQNVYFRPSHRRTGLKDMHTNVRTYFRCSHFAFIFTALIYFWGVDKWCAYLTVERGLFIWYSIMLWIRKPIWKYC